MPLQYIRAWTCFITYMDLDMTSDHVSNQARAFLTMIHYLIADVYLPNAQALDSIYFIVALARLP